MRESLSSAVATVVECRFVRCVRSFDTVDCFSSISDRVHLVNRREKGCRSLQPGWIDTEGRRPDQIGLRHRRLLRLERMRQLPHERLALGSLVGIERFGL